MTTGNTLLRTGKMKFPPAKMMLFYKLLKEMEWFVADGPDSDCADVPDEEEMMKGNPMKKACFAGEVRGTVPPKKASLAPVKMRKKKIAIVLVPVVVHFCRPSRWRSCACAPRSRSRCST